jgi:hypothetical protein
VEVVVSDNVKPVDARDVKAINTLRALVRRHGREAGGDALDRARAAMPALERLEKSLGYWKQWADDVTKDAEGVLLAGGRNLVEWRELALRLNAEAKAARADADRAREALGEEVAFSAELREERDVLKETVAVLTERVKNEQAATLQHLDAFERLSRLHAEAEAEAKRLRQKHPCCRGDA